MLEIESGVYQITLAEAYDLYMTATRMPNVAVKPSSYRLDVPAPKLKLGGTEATGTTVLSWKARKVDTSNCPWTRRKDKGKTCKRTVHELTHAKNKKGQPHA